MDDSSGINRWDQRYWKMWLGVGLAREQRRRFGRPLLSTPGTALRTPTGIHEHAGVRSHHWVVYRMRVTSPRVHRSLCVRNSASQV